MKKIMFCQLSVALACLATLVSSASAAVIVTSTKDVAPGGAADHDPYSPGAGFVASSTDLAEGLAATHDANDTYELSAGASTWTDGSIATVYGVSGSGGDAIDHAAYGTVQGSSTLTFDLGALYDLEKIDVFTGWNDSGRDDISFDLLVSVDDVTYSSIATYVKPDDDTGTHTTPVTNLHSVTDDGGGAIAAGVQFVRLAMSDADNGNAGIVEIDVHAVPEPTSIAMAVAGLATLMLRRRA